MMQPLANAAKSAGVKRIIYTSAPKATTMVLVLAPEHKATEEYLVASGLTYAIPHAAPDDAANTF